MTQRIPVAQLPESVVWVATELDLLDHDDTLSRSHVRTLGEFLLRFGGGNSMSAPAKATRTRTKQQKLKSVPSSQSASTNFSPHIPAQH